jgi:hypothetical protein
MRLGIIGPSKLESLNEVNKDARKIISDIARLVANSNNEIIVVPDKGSASEFFAQEYFKSKGRKIYEIVPLDDKEFGISWLNLNVGEHINCGTWRNQPEKLNEECDAFLCIGYAVGVLAEIAYSKWFKPKPVYIVKKLVSGKLPKEVEKSLRLEYVSLSQLKNIFK